MKKLIKVLGIILVILLVAYAVLMLMPGASVDSKEVVENITAESLYDAYTSDEKAAQANYLGKAVIVNGILQEKYKDEHGQPVLIIGPMGKDPYTLITLEKSQENGLENITIGSQISVKAICTGMLMEVTLNKGLIL